MNKRASAMGLLTLLLAGCGIMEPDVGNSILKLPECSNADTVFASLQLESMSNVYHSTVSRVIDAHLNELADINTLPLTCTANDYRGLLKPSSALEDLANQLPEWGPSRTATLSEADLGSVLLEYLRVYECSLLQRGQFLNVFILREQGTMSKQTDGTELQVMNRADLTKEQVKQRDIIARELETARPMLERTIAFLGGIDRLRPLTAELECLKRASLDLRNVTGLLAEASSCMPKAWDARGSLRDLAGDGTSQ